MIVMLWERIQTKREREKLDRKHGKKVPRSYILNFLEPYIPVNLISSNCLIPLYNVSIHGSQSDIVSNFSCSSFI